MPGISNAQPVFETQQVSVPYISLPLGYDVSGSNLITIKTLIMLAGKLLRGHSNCYSINKN